MTISENIGGHLVPTWLAEYHDYMAWASRVNPWPLQARRPTPTQQQAEVEQTLTGSTTQAAIRKRYQPPPTERATS